MGDAEFNTIKERAAAMTDKLNADLARGFVACGSCGREHKVSSSSWVVECVCGWSAAGQTPELRQKH